jgi:hypothetical protein
MPGGREIMLNQSSNKVQNILANGDLRAFTHSLILNLIITSFLFIGLLIIGWFELGAFSNALMENREWFVISFFFVRLAFDFSKFIPRIADGHFKAEW